MLISGSILFLLIRRSFSKFGINSLWIFFCNFDFHSAPPYSALTSTYTGILPLPLHTLTNSAPPPTLRGIQQTRRGEWVEIGDAALISSCWMTVEESAYGVAAAKHFFKSRLSSVSGVIFARKFRRLVWVWVGVLRWRRVLFSSSSFFFFFSRLKVISCDRGDLSRGSDSYTTLSCVSLAADHSRPDYAWGDNWISRVRVTFVVFVGGVVFIVRGELVLGVKFENCGRKKNQQLEVWEND